MMKTKVESEKSESGNRERVRHFRFSALLKHAFTF
jgi:hypothetical protein